MSKFDMGSIIFTANVQNTMNRDEAFEMFVHQALDRFKNGDWGNLDAGDIHYNEQSILYGGSSIFGSYSYPSYPNLIVWIVTEWDRSKTTIMFPFEY